MFHGDIKPANMFYAEDYTEDYTEDYNVLIS